MLKSHLSVLETSASLHPTSPAFKVPRLDLKTGQVQDWHSISYQQFQSDVELFAKYWSRILKSDAIPRRSVVGLWLGGMTYTDVLHIYGVSRAGFVPQLFSLRLPSPVVIFELLQKSNARALIYDSSFDSILKDSPLPIHLAVGVEKADAEGEPLPDMPKLCADEMAFVFHTSGSTSGSPKLVPCSYKWLDSAVHKASQITKPRNSDRQDVMAWMGSMCHICQPFMLLGILQHGSCVIQPTMLAFSSEELVDMIQRCGLNRLNQFATFLAPHLRNSRLNSLLLSMLSNLDEVVYTGLPLAREEGEWAHRNGINVKNLFGSTECGAMLISGGGRDDTGPLLRPLEGVSYTFVPITPATQTESGHQSTAQLMELIILADSGDCPDVSLRHPDGHFHTGDLFQEATPGSYIFRGRNDDWIKSENSLRCDTKSIEDNVRAMCGKLIQECIVVGAGRPSPVMFIEPAGDIDQDKLKKEIIRKTRHFHSRRYVHERITSTKMIIVVPPWTLPRTATKGNIRRQAVEEAYKSQLDQIYGLL